MANDSWPDPFVVMNCPLLPSEVGNVKPLIVTPPVPLPVNSSGLFDAFVDMVLSLIVMPSIVTDEVVSTEVKVPAAGVEPPITVPSIVPPSMSRSLCTITVPVPLG